ncbi:leukocyte surface antigen CD53 [Pelobates cultripes]|uniref:Tetraspanin n=1 Tax=Pelobates cultripes TaxID=61616 RepID=A0AAD1VMY9_PELCU|nr:leukocyte surface antigen CD53 [Pelobates cultripes]
MSQECIRVLKYMMFVFNLIFWVAGCSIIAMGIYYLVNDIYGTLVPETSSLTVGNILIVTGCIIMVFGFIGCMGAIKENKCLLLTFFILLLLILIIEVVLAIVLYVYEKKVGDHVMAHLTTSFEEQRKETANNKTKQLWHDIQNNVKCCGINGTSDWGTNIPKSCCENTECTRYFPTGCSKALEQWFNDNFWYVGIITICISIVEVLGMSFALTLYCHISRNSVSLNK